MMLQGCILATGCVVELCVILTITGIVSLIYIVKTTSYRIITVILYVVSLCEMV